VREGVIGVAGSVSSDAVFIRRLTHALARRGHEVEVIHDVDAFEFLHPSSIDVKNQAR
jgi:ActR/RegA family two-component response regulator